MLRSKVPARQAAADGSILMQARLAGKSRWRLGKQKQTDQKQADKKQRASDKTRAALDAAMGLYGLSSFKLFWNPTTDTKALLAWNGETAVLAFRGTASLTNAWLDLKVLSLLLLLIISHPASQQLIVSCPLNGPRSVQA